VTIGADQHALLWQDGKPIDLGNQFADADSGASDELAAGSRLSSPGPSARRYWSACRSKAPGPRLVRPEVFERAFGLLADLYQEQ
jgi:hypothetical protein